MDVVAATVASDRLIDPGVRAWAYATGQVIFSQWVFFAVGVGVFTRWRRGRRAEAPDYPVGPLSLLVVQPTPFCNIDCDYCYLPQRNMRAIIQTETLERLFASVFASSILASRGFSLVWHAGEPLVLPVDFYRQANEILGGRLAAMLTDNSKVTCSSARM